MVSDQKNLFKNNKYLSEVYTSVDGKQNFDQAVEKFDQMNGFLINLYQHHLKSVEKLLPENEKGLVDQLSKLPDYLYWRKSK
jgi:uncharacterized membrane-anchored protein YhcB (DUF1043 family)